MCICNIYVSYSTHTHTQIYTNMHTHIDTDAHTVVSEKLKRSGGLVLMKQLPPTCCYLAC